MENQNEIENKDIILTVNLDDGTTKDCRIITSFIETSTDKKYVIYAPLDEVESNSEEVSLYGAIFQEEDGEVVLIEATEEEDLKILNKVIDDLLEEADKESEED